MGLLQDFRYAGRTLRKSPGFTLVAVATLGLSLGANTAIFSYINAVLLQPLPYPGADRIVRVLESPPGGGRNGISTLNFLDWQKQNACFEYLAAQTGGNVSLTGVDEPIQIPGARVSARFFDVFGLKAALGRTFLDGEDQVGRDHEVVLSDALWRSQFGSDRTLVGRTIRLDGEAYTVVGVLPAGTPFERGYPRLWRPLAFKPENMTRNFHWMGAIGRLKPGVTLGQAQAQMTAIGVRIAHDYPDSNKGWGVGLDRLADTIVITEVRTSLWVLLGAVGMVLLIACANLANLSLMRVVARDREVAIRTALGAGRWALARQFLAESLLVSLLGGAAGVGVGRLVMIVLKANIPQGILPTEANIALNGPVLLFSFGLALLTGVLIGLFPAWHAARPGLTDALKQGGISTSTGGAGARVRGGLVVAEVALAFMLLTGAGLLIRSFDRITAADPGFDATNVLVFRLPVATTTYPDPVGLNAYLRQITDRLQALPGVTDVAMTSALPLRGWGYGMPYQVADKPTVDRAHRRACYFKMVSASYFHAFRIRLVSGRTLAVTDTAGMPPVAVINETMAKREFPGVSPLGKRLLVQQIVPGKTELGDEIGWEIVGVVADEQVGGLDNLNGSPGMYVTTDQSPIYGGAVAVRSATDTGLLREAVKKAIHQINPDQALAGLNTMEQIKADTVGPIHFRAQLLASFALLSLVLSAIGIYGVIAYSMAQRTREIGIRAALGATRGDILRLVLRSGLILTGLGLVLGIAGALGLTRVLASMLFQVKGYDPLTMATVAAALALVALLACLLPARKATKVDPVIALRTE